jgi:hypothetical protein
MHNPHVREIFTYLDTLWYRNPMLHKQHGKGILKAIVAIAAFIVAYRSVHYG